MQASRTVTFLPCSSTRMVSPSPIEHRGAIARARPGNQGRLQQQQHTKKQARSQAHRTSLRASSLASLLRSGARLQSLQRSAQLTHELLIRLGGCLRDSPPGKSNTLEQKHTLLAPARGSVDQQATRRAETDPGSIVNSSRLSGSQGVTSFLKVTSYCASSDRRWVRRTLR